MRRAKPSPFLTLPQIHAETEMGELSIRVAATGCIIDSSCHRRNRRLQRFEFRQPFRQRVGRTGSLEVARRSETNLHTVARRQFKKVRRRQNSTSPTWLL